jgi:uncharacterized RDD family membrane protein YckC
MFCPRCGRTVPEGARFCPNCGAAVTVVALPDDEPAGAPAPFPSSPAPGGPTMPPAWALPTGGGAAPAFGAAAESMPGLPETQVAPLPADQSAYGGFWRRVIAVVIDGFLLNILMSPLYLGWVWPVMMSAGRTRPDDLDPTQAMAIVGTCLGFLVVGGLIETAYFAFLESSTQQASLGKLALGLKLTDLEGARITLGRAVLRRVARTLTAFTLGIGFLMMLWTKRRQTLHDLMAGTLVLRR